MKKIIALFFSMIVLAVTVLAAAGTYSKTVFYNDVAVGSWTSVAGASAALTNGGLYTNGTPSFYWRLNATNAQGRLPVASAVFTNWVGTTNGNGTNAVLLSWTAKDGVMAYVIERSQDGTSWTNWVVVPVASNSWRDTGAAGVWSVGSFTNLYAVIPAPSVPWGATAFTNTLDQVTTAGNSTTNTIDAGKYKTNGIDVVFGTAEVDPLSLHKTGGTMLGGINMSSSPITTYSIAATNGGTLHLEGGGSVSLDALAGNVYATFGPGNYAVLDGSGNNKDDIGSSSAWWRNGYFGALYVNGVLLATNSFLGNGALVGYITGASATNSFAPIAEPLSLHVNGDNAMTGPLNAGGQSVTNICRLSGTNSVIFSYSELGYLPVGNAPGSSQWGYMFRGLVPEPVMSIGSEAYGASQHGYVNSASAINNGIGSMQLFNLVAQTATMTGNASLGLGACTVSNNQAIVAGDGQVSHGDGSISAGGGFYGSGSALTGLNGTNIWNGSIDSNKFNAATKALLGQGGIGTSPQAGYVVATNAWSPGQYLQVSGGSASGIYTGFWSSVSGSGDMTKLEYDTAGSAKQVVFTNNPALTNERPATAASLVDRITGASVSNNFVSTNYASPLSLTGLGRGSNWWVDSSGNMAIGSNTPAARLYVTGSGTLGAYTWINQQAPAAGANAGVLLSITNTVYGRFGVSGGNDGLITGAVLGDFGVRSAKRILFSADDGNTACIVINTNGSVVFNNGILGYITGASATNSFAPVAEPLSLHINGDNAMTGDLYTGLGSIKRRSSSTAGITMSDPEITTTGNIVPKDGDINNLGSPSKSWSNGYFCALYTNGVALNFSSGGGIGDMTKLEYDTAGSAKQVVFTNNPALTNERTATAASLAGLITGSSVTNIVRSKLAASTNADYAAISGTSTSSAYATVSGSSTNATFAVTAGSATNAQISGTASNVLALLDFTNKVLAASSGAYVPTNRTITIDGTTYDLSANRSFTTAAGSGPTFAQATNIAAAVMSLAPMQLTDARFWLAGLSNAPQSVRAKMIVSQMPSSRATDIVYKMTNMLFYSVTSTVAGVAGQFSNNVADASGFIPEDMYTKPDASLPTWQTCSNGSGTAVYWANELGDVSSNLVATSVGGTISRVNRSKVFDYYDATGGTNIYCYLRFLTPYTNTVAWSVQYLSGTNRLTTTGSQVITNSAAITIPYVR